MEVPKVSELLELAREQIAIGDYKRAVRTLRQVGLVARYDLDEAHGLLDLAMAIRNKDGRRLRKHCDDLCIVAEQIITSFEREPLH